MTDNAQAMTSRQAGFSVIEAIAALALLSIVLALTSTALNASRHALRRVIAQDGDIRFATSMRFVEQRLADAQPLYEQRIGNQANIHFVGEPEHVAFLAAFEDGEMPGGLYRVELGRLVTTKGLALRMTPHAPNRRKGTAPSQQRTIDAGVSNFEIQYFGPGPDNENRSWQDTWKGRASFPLAIHVKAWRNGKSAGAIYVPLRPGRSLINAAG